MKQISWYQVIFLFLYTLFCNNRLTLKNCNNNTKFLPFSILFLNFVVKTSNPMIIGGYLK